MADFEARDANNERPGPQPGQHPETVYINRFEPGAKPPPPDFDTLPFVPAWKVRGEPFQSLLARLPPKEVRNKQIYSALVKAAIAGVIDTDELAAGIRPRTGTVLPFTGLSLQQRYSYLNELLNKEPTRVFWAAHNRAQEIISPPILDWPSMPEPPERQKNSYQRLMGTLSMMAAQAGVPVEAYYSWGGSVSAYYRGPYSERVGNDKDVHWGADYAKDLVRYPGLVTRRFKPPERNWLESSFVNLRGIPHLDRVEDLKEVVAGLPQGTPVLCFTANNEAITLQAHPYPRARQLEPQGFNRPMVLLLNLVILRNLRTGGREASGAFLGILSHYASSKLAENLDALQQRLGAGSGVLKRTKRHPRDIYRADFSIANNSFVLDARRRPIKST